MVAFIGREKEVGDLRLLLKKKSASFVVLRGRRRIGKSRLIAQFGSEIPFKLFSGLPPDPQTTKQSQIEDFCEQMATNFNMPKISTSSWGEVFWHLGQQVSQGRVLLALDEIAWIGSRDPHFLGQLKNAWDLYFSKNDELILIVCGSVSSWIQKNLLSSTGFVGRVSLDMRLGELSIREAAQFWGDRLNRTSSHEILRMLCVTGAVPRYLEEVYSDLPTEENIKRLCFEQKGFLYGEFDKIFSDLFSSKASVYSKIIEQLAHGACRLEEITKQIGIERRATLSDYLNDLVQAGFVSIDPTWDLKTLKTSRLRKFRLSDNYIRFYMKCIHPAKDRIARGVYQSQQLSDLPQWNGVMGLQFENLVLNNVHSLLPLLRLNFSDILMFGPYFQRRNQRQAGCQVDLLIQAKYRTLFMCEVKFSSQPIGVSVVSEIKEKLDKFVCPRGWSVRPVLIHVSGVTDDLVRADFFDHIIDFSQLVKNN